MIQKLPGKSDWCVLSALAQVFLLALLLCGCAASPDLFNSPDRFEELRAVPVVQHVQRSPQFEPPAQYRSSAGELGWNYWFSELAKNEPISRTALELNHVYHLRLQLSPFDLSEQAPTQAGRIVTSDALKRLIDRQRSQRTSIALYAVVTAADPATLKIVGSQTAIPFSVDLTKLQELGVPTPRAEADSAEGSFQRMAAANIGEFAFDFSILAPGRQRAGIVIIDKDSGAPVQTMTVELAGTSSTVGVAPGGTPGLDSQGAPAADLSLVLHDLSSIGSPVLVVTLAVRDYEKSEYELLTWYAGGNIDSLKSAISGFRSDLQVQSLPVIKKVGLDLGNFIFRPRVDPKSLTLTAENRATAERAKAHLLAAMTAAADTPKVMLARIAADGARRSDFSSPTLPIGAIAFGTTPENAVFLGDRLIVSLLLPGQTVASSDDCTDAWYVAKPPQLDNDPLAVARADAVPFWTFAGPSTVQISPSMSELSSWLDESGGEAPRVVFTYLGHNSTNLGLYMDERQGAIKPYTMTRSFDPRSIAILDACDISPAEIDGQTAVGKLAELHVGSTIATMAPVRERAAAAFMNCVAEVLDQKGRMPIGELNLLTERCLSSEAHHYAGEALKYFLVGNPYQQICSPRTR